MSSPTPLAHSPVQAVASPSSAPVGGKYAARSSLGAYSLPSEAAAGSQGRPQAQPEASHANVSIQEASPHHQGRPVLSLGGPTDHQLRSACQDKEAGEGSNEPARAPLSVVNIDARRRHSSSGPIIAIVYDYSTLYYFRQKLDRLFYKLI